MSNFLDKIEIGNTGLTTSRLGIGSTFNAPASAIEEAFEQGINYLYWGTVRQPSFAEAMRNLERSHRDDLILTIQSYSNDAGTIEKEVEDALAQAGVQSFDFLLLGNRNAVPDQSFIDVFERLKDRQLVRFLSLSSHNRPLVPTFIEDYANGNSPYEILMLRYNAVHRGAETDVFPYVQDTQPRQTILAYTATRWGHLVDPAKMPSGEQPVSACDCYRYSLSHPSVDMVLCGPANRDQMQEAIAALHKGPLDPKERERIERIGKHLYGQYAPAYPDAGDDKDVKTGLAASASA